MRYVLERKGDPRCMVLGISSMPEKVFERSVVCVEEDGIAYKVLSLAASNDGSIFLFLNYCKETTAFAFLYRHPGGHMARIGQSEIKTEYEVLFSVDTQTKLSYHRTGFVQLSGKGVLSGSDPLTGQAKGIGVYSSPLAKLINSGPSLGLTCWGVRSGFQPLHKRKSGIQYVVVRQDEFVDTSLFERKTNNAYTLEIFILPPAAKRVVYEHQGKFYINLTLPTLIGVRDHHQTFALPVLDIPGFDGVICIFPKRMWAGLADEHAYGFTTGSPRGSLAERDYITKDYAFAIVCPGGRAMSVRNPDVVQLLKY